MWALKIVIIVSLVLGVTSGTSADFGVGNGAIYGVIAGLARGENPVLSWGKQRPPGRPARPAAIER